MASSLPRRGSKQPTATVGQDDFPALFTIQGSNANRHEIILVNPGHDLDELKETIQGLAGSSPNCAEFMSKYRSKDVTDNVTEIRVRWASEGRDERLFPQSTLLTEESSEAVLRMMAIGGGKDVFDVKLEQKNQAQAEEGAKK